MKEKTNKGWSMDKTLVGMEKPAGTIIQRCSVNKVFWKIVENSLEILVLESLFNEVPGLEICNVVKKWLQQRCFHVNFAKFF